MKKFILMIAMAFSMFALQSCKETPFGFDYSLSLNGDALGNVQFNLPVGHIALDGTSKVDVLVTNDSTKLSVFGAPVTDALVLGESLTSDDKDVVAAASAVDAWLAQNFSVTTAEGSYYVHLVGYVKESATGLTFYIDREFTNRLLED